MLHQILAEIKSIRVMGPEEVMVSHITSDSRQVKPGSLFVAIRGVQVDGHAYIGKAIEAGASVIICEEFSEQVIPEAVRIVVVEDSAFS
ncbi:MAG: UDP-N-acetylmuramoyl-L-alanyl-D-glutamate--2,6-diaminopimelate ligase, partial [Chitinophagaceae bacterium]|nr:UDP-N-acetylmuramoyl-L-alanyl-D-glutamate--2,6-diaminopimelate ligase [Chitinophagaceae bacterium]